MHLTLFFTYGVSLETWVKNGLFQREIVLYKKLIEKYNMDIQFITFGDASDYKYEKLIENISIIPVYNKICRPKSKILRFFKSLSILWIYKDAFKETDIIKTNQQWGSWLAVLVKIIYSKPLIIRSGYNIFNHLNNGFVKIISFLLMKFSYKYANQIHVSSELDKISIINTFKINNNKIIVRPNWIDTSSFFSINKKQNKRVLFVGRFNNQKNIDLLLSAIKGTNIGLDMIGSGEKEKQIIDFKNKYKLDLNLLGNISNDKLPDIYNGYSVYVLCSLYEGNPKSLLEAMSCEMAVIGTDVIGIKEVIENKVSGIIVDLNHNNLRKAIQELLINEKMCLKLGINARKTILNNNSLEKALIKEFNCYSEL